MPDDRGHYYFNHGLSCLFEMPTSVARRLVPSHLQPLEVQHERSVLSVTAFDFFGGGFDNRMAAWLGLVLLGTGMFALHNVGILSRSLIASVLHGVAASESGSFMDGLYAEPLDTAESQPEEISISQEPVDVDQATKLWSALQSPLRPSAFYRVQAVFLVPDEAYPDPNTVDEVNIAVVPDPVRAAQWGEQ